MTASTQYTIFVWSWIGLAGIVFIVLQFIPAPYGRHTKQTWKPLISNRFAWSIMEVFVLVVMYFFLLRGTNSQTLASRIIIGLFTIHYLNRGIIYPLRIKTNGKKMPVVIMVSALSFNLANGFIFGYYLGNLRTYSNDWLLRPQFLIGFIMFVIGMIINIQSDNILIGLRKPGETGYSIPTGKLFRYISAPNHFGEIIEWCGFAILVWGLPGWAFLAWTLANLLPRAMSHHKWYQEKFPDYPRERKAVIPFLW